MLATILIVFMILLQTGALSLGLMMDRRFITASGGLEAQIVALNQSAIGSGPKGADRGNREVVYAFTSTRSDPDRGGCSPRAD